MAENATRKGALDVTPGPAGVKTGPAALTDKRMARTYRGGGN